VSDPEFLQWGHLATSAACMLWDWHSWDVLSAKHVELARASGALAALSIALNGRGMFTVWCGDVEATTALVANTTRSTRRPGSAGIPHVGSSNAPIKDGRRR
jgi:hypothetical protein